MSKRSARMTYTAMAAALAVMALSPTTGTSAAPAESAPPAPPQATSSIPPLVARPAGPVARDPAPQTKPGGWQLSHATVIPESVEEKLARQGDNIVIVIVQLSDPDLVSYRGGISGLAATAPSAAGRGRFNPNSAASRAYAAHLVQQQQDFVSSAVRLSPGAQVVATYKAAINGVALRLPASDALELRSLPGVARIYLNEIHKPTTDVSPDFIGATDVWAQLGGQSQAGEGVIIGVLDTGLWSPNTLTPSLQYTQTIDSFSGAGYTIPFTSVTGRVYTKTLGVCDPDDPQPSDGTFACNEKVIGGYWYNATGIAFPGEVDSPLDEDGHGSHTSSTAGGNGPVTATYGFTSPLATISGIAPRARLIHYKVCWNEDPTDAEDGGCGFVDSVSAIDQAILDGVHSINYSIGGGTDPLNDIVEAAFLRARNAGIFVAASAGNDGPTVETVEHVSPWVMSVAASEHDRTYRSTVELTSTVTVPITDLKGASATPGATGRAVLAPLQMATGEVTQTPGLCLQPFSPGTFQSDEIVICRRGINPRVEKAANVAAGGAGGFILVNSAPNQGLALDRYPIPGVHLEYNATSFSASGGEDLVVFLRATVPTDVVTITLSGGVRTTKQGDVIAAFSSRGPTALGLNVVKPDVAAPGVEILAAVSPQVWDDFNPDGFPYFFMNGTSMASPHVAGAGALMVALHPDWSPAQIQSALMSSAKPILLQDGATPATPLDEGSGRIDLTRAMTPGLVFAPSAADYQAYVSATLAIEDLNLPSAAQTQCLATCSWTRTGLNVMGAESTYTWTVVSATPGLSVTLDQVSYTVPASDTLAFTITADVTALPTGGDYSFARVLLVENDTGIQVAIPVAVIAAASVLPGEIDIVTPRTSGSQDFTVTSLEVTDLVTDIDGLAPGIRHTGVVTGDSDTGDYLDDVNDGVAIIVVNVPTGTRRLRGEVLDTTSQDIDLFLHRDTNDNGFLDAADELVADSATPNQLETVDYVTASLPADTYFFALQNFDAGSSPPDSYTFETAVVPDSDLGNAEVVGPETAPASTPFTATLIYNIPEMMPGDNYYGLVTLGTDPGNPDNIGSVRVNIHRTAAEVTKSVSPATAIEGDVVTYTITVQNFDAVSRTYMVTDVLPTGTTYISGSLSGPGATFDSGLNAVLVSASIGGGGVSSEYVIQDSLTMPGLEDDSPFGGYVDLRPLLGIPPNNLGDDVAGNFASLGCNFEFYDTSLGTASTIGFSSNGLFFPRGTSVAGGGANSPDRMAIPAVITPNGFIAAYWDDLVVSNLGAVVTPSGYLAASTGDCPNAGVIQVVNAYRSENPAEVINYELQYDTALPDEYWVLYDDISGTLPSRVVGIEDPTGTRGTAYTGPVTPGLVLRYFRPVIVPEPMTVTFQVIIDSFPDSVLTNTAEYSVDVPDTVVMETAPAILGRNDAPGNIDISATPDTVPADGVSPSHIVVTVTDLGGNPVVSSTKVSFTTNRFVAALSGVNEVPPVTTTASGRATFDYDPISRTLTYRIDQTGMVSITMAHIHSGTAGVNGPVRYWFCGNVPATPTGVPSCDVLLNTGVLTGQLTISAEDEARLLTNRLYFNIHSPTNPGGEIRGQITDGKFNAALSGLNEVPPVTTTLGSGQATFSYNPFSRQLYYRLEATGLVSVTMSHIHRAPAGVNGGIGYVFCMMDANCAVIESGAPLVGSFTLSAADEALLFTEGLYVNIHTSDNPGGEIRGQIIGGLMAWTDPSGNAAVDLTSDVAGVFQVSAIISDSTRLVASTPVTFTAGAAAMLSVMVTPSTLPADGTSTADVQATVVDTNSNPVAGVPVVLLASAGTITPQFGTSGPNGVVTATLTAPTTAGNGTVFAVAGTHIASAVVTFTQSPSTTNFSLSLLGQTTDTVRTNDIITYTFTVTNSGPGDATNVLIVAPIPNGTEYVEDSAVGGVPFGGTLAALLAGRIATPAAAQDVTAIIWQGDIPAGESHTVEYAVQVTALDGPITNTARVYLDNQLVASFTAVAAAQPGTLIYLPIVYSDSP